MTGNILSKDQAQCKVWGWQQSGFFKDLEYAKRGSVANMATRLVLVIVRMYKVFLGLEELLLRIFLELCTWEITQRSPAIPLKNPAYGRQSIS